MKLFHVFWNYLKFVRKQGSTAWLTLLYPIMLILVIGIGLNIQTSNRIHVAVYGDDSVLDIISSEQSLDVTRAGSLDELLTLVRGKKAVMGIVVTKDEGGKRIDIYLDSTKQAVASNMLLLVDRAVNEEKARSGSDLTAIQKKLAPAYVQLKDKRQEIANFSVELTALRQNLSQVRGELVAGRAALSNYSAELRQYRSNLSLLDEYSSRLDSYDSRLGGLYDDVSYREAQRDNMLYSLNSNIAKIDGYLYRINSTLYYVQMAKSNLSYGTVAYAYIVDVENELLSMRSDLQGSKNDMVLLRGELMAIDFDSIKGNISAIRLELAYTNIDLGSFRSAADGRISSMLGQINGTDAKLSYAIAKLDEYDGRIALLQNKAVEFDSLMGAVLGPLGDFLGKKPEDLLPPRIVSTSIFGDVHWIDMFFPSIIGIDMLLASLLLPMIMKVRMREQGAELRIMRSRASSFSVVLGELFANYAISMFQLFLICAIGIIFFGVNLGGVFGFLLVFVTLPLVFTSAGVLLSQAVNRSSTAFLLSLLIAIPMIFISGTIIPLEFLDPLIAGLGTLLPLYIVIDFGEKLLFRNVPPFEVLVDWVYLMLFVFISTMMAVVLYALKR